jgi:hypothetical protein
LSGDDAALRRQNPLEGDVANCFGGGKADDVHLKIAQNSILKTINEPMHGQLATARPGIAHKRGTAKIADLEDHIDFAELFHAVDRIVYGFDLFAISLESFGNRRKPVIDESDGASSKGRLNATATVVAANNDVDDLEDIDGILDGREAIEIGQGDDVCDVAVDKDLARLQADDFACRHSAVRASDPQKLWNLLLGEPLEEPGLLFAHFPRPIPVMLKQRLKIYSEVAAHRRATLGATPDASKGGYLPSNSSRGKGAREERRSIRRILRRTVRFGRTGDHFRGLGRMAARAIIWLRES